MSTSLPSNMTGSKSSFFFYPQPSLCYSVRDEVGMKKSLLSVITTLCVSAAIYAATTTIIPMANAADAVPVNLATQTKSVGTWIWYPGDYEIWLGNRMNNRRTERGSFYPPYMWRIDSHFPIVEFHKSFHLDAAETLHISAEGQYNVALDGRRLFGAPEELELAAGDHNLIVQVFNQATPPALFIEGTTLGTDGSWQVVSSDKKRLPEKNYNFVSTDAGYWNFNSAGQKPSAFKLSTELWKPVSHKTVQGGELFDFGKETFGFLQFTGLKGQGTIRIGYGESPEEALDWDRSETVDLLSLADGKVTDTITHQTTAAGQVYTQANTKAFRYVHVVTDKDVSYQNVQMLYEYLPLTYRGAFRCNDEELNHIWDVGAYTLHLTTRESFIDGIKRDRWAWSGDALQSYLMNYYLFFDQDTTKRTIWLLRGKDPVYCHINTILDYTFYWFQGIYDYYLYTGDEHFVKQIYPRMQSMMDFILSRTNANGMVEGQPGDWVFIDWTDGPMDKSGEISFEQILFCKSLETMKLCADLLQNKADSTKYSKLSTELRAKLEPTFWNDSKQAFVNNVVNGKQSDAVTRYANMFAIFFNYISPEKQQLIKKSVLLNDQIMKISTPYMRFYELEAFCAMGEQTTVLKEMKDYWGGMIKEGATSFWEKYNPENTGTQHLEMYGRPYGKSLCHAWGASPLYLLGKYYLGVKPTSPGYKEYAVTPVLGGLEWMEGTVPTPKGDIHIYCDTKTIKIRADYGQGTLTFHSETTPQANHGTPTKHEGNTWTLRIPPGQEIIVTIPE